MRKEGAPHESKFFPLEYASFYKEFSLQDTVDASFLRLRGLMSSGLTTRQAMRVIFSEGSWGLNSEGPKCLVWDNSSLR